MPPGPRRCVRRGAESAVASAVTCGAGPIAVPRAGDGTWDHGGRVNGHVVDRLAGGQNVGGRDASC